MAAGRDAAVHHVRQRGRRKSTLIRPTATGQSCDDQMRVEAGRVYGTRGWRIPFALLLDGLQAEREQASPSTWPTASSPHRSAARHVRHAGPSTFTRNMATSYTASLP